MSKVAGDRKRVMVACCAGTAWLHKIVAMRLMNLLRDSRHEVTIILPTHKPYVHALHLVVRDFLAGGYDFLLSVDDDNPWHQGVNPLDLVELDLDVVGLPTPVWHSDASKPQDRPYYANALKEVRDPDGSVAFRPLDSLPGFRGAGLHRADAVGTGCILIARRVLAELVRRSVEADDPLQAPFMRTWNADGTVEIGNDYSFCRRARAAGFRVWAHFDYTCEHFNELPLTEAIGSLLRFRMDAGRRAVR